MFLTLKCPNYFVFLFRCVSFKKMFETILRTKEIYTTSVKKIAFFSMYVGNDLEGIRKVNTNPEETLPYVSWFSIRSGIGLR